MNISLNTLILFEDFRKSLYPLLQAHKVKVKIEIETRNEIYLEDTTYDGVDNFIPGTITQTFQPVNYITIDFWQEEKHEYIHQMPGLPFFRFRINDVNKSLLEFLSKACTLILSENIPDSKIWENS